MYIAAELVVEMFFQKVEWRLRGRKSLSKKQLEGKIFKSLNQSDRGLTQAGDSD